MPITILLVDDSEVVRFLFSKSLERDPDLRVVGNATNGREAIELAKKLQPDMILLDIEMPVMDGLTALPLIFAASPRSKVFIISGDSRKNANAAIESLSLGASEFILKLGSAGAMKPQIFHEELRLKIKAIVGTKEASSRPPLPRPAATDAPSPAIAPSASTTAEPISTKKLAPITALHKPSPVAAPLLKSDSADASTKMQIPKNTEIHALAIASSTGGPEALLRVFSDLNGRLAHIPIFITQHMPPLFTAALAEHIARNGKRVCREAVAGEKVAAGVVYVAPGGYHMIVKKVAGSDIIQLTQDAPVNSCRPSADPMFASISNVYGRNVLGVVLTGIGNDGCQGAKVILENGGSIIGQDKASSVVYGMPKSVAEAGVCEAIVPISEMADAIIRRCGLRYA